MNAKLIFYPDLLRLEWSGQTADIILSVTDLIRQFSPYPPGETIWERAIMQVEDAISPYRDRLRNYRRLELTNAAPLHALADNRGKLYTADFERAFAVLAGYRPGYDFPELTHKAETAAYVLVLREWMHHLDFDVAAFT